MAGTSSSGGRNRKTPEQHRATGTFRRDRHAGTVGPSVPEGVPVSPKPLDGDAAEEWDRMIARLTHSGALSQIDDGVLYQYCRLFAETEAIAISQLETAASIDIIEENLAGLKGPDLAAVFQEISKLRQLEARYTTQIRQGRMAIRQYLVEFGLTPSARGRVKLPDRQDVDPFSEFDGGGQSH